jgi:hypothetical protein
MNGEVSDVPDDANHVLKHESRPRSELDAAQVLSSYNGPETALDADAMAGIIRWLAARTSQPIVPGC